MLSCMMQCSDHAISLCSIVQNNSLRAATQNNIITCRLIASTDWSTSFLAWPRLGTTTSFPSMDPPSFDNSTELRPPQQSIGASSSSKRARESPPSPADFYLIGKDIQNRFGQSIGSNKSEDRRFRSYFGCGVEVAVEVWNALVNFDPPGWRADSSSSLGTLLYEVLPNRRNCMRSCRWAHRGNWPKDTSKIHLAIHWGHCQLGAML